MNMTLTIEIPALDRLCGLLEAREQGTGNREQGTGNREHVSFSLSDLREAISRDDPAKPEPTTAPEAVEAPREAEKPEATNAPEKPEAPAPAPATEPTVTLNAVQKAAAQLRDEGKLEAVKGLFPEFGIRKLSDLTGDALQGFADRLRGMGAKI